MSNAVSSQRSWKWIIAQAGWAADPAASPADPATTPADPVAPPVVAFTGGFGSSRGIGGVPTRAASGAGSVYGLSAGYSSVLGSYNATPIASSSSWSVGLQQGSFDWSYDVPMPPTGFGAAPSVSMSYSSSVDGIVSDENTQAGMLGGGWNLNAGGFIERSYKSCDVDGWAIQDFCWFSDNATISLNGRSSEMYYTGVGGRNTWSERRLRDDPGWKIVRSRHAAGSTTQPVRRIAHVAARQAKGSMCSTA